MGDALRPIEFVTDDGTDGGTALTAKSLACGARHMCSILSDDTVKCWGSSESGKLGQGNTYYFGDYDYEMGNNLAAVDLGTDGNGNSLTAKSVMAGYQYTCAVLSDDTVKCWKCDYQGILGEQTTFGGIGDHGRDDYVVGDEADDISDNLGIVPLGTSRTVLNTFAPPEGDGVCAVLDDYSLKCWGGHTESGMLGNEEAALDHDYIGDGLERNAGGVLVRTGFTEMGDNLAAVNLGIGRTVLKIVFCSDNEYVASNVCTVCPAGESNPAGDEQNGADTTCSCTASTDSSKGVSDGNFYCINGGITGWTTGSCTCTSCDAGFGGSNCHIIGTCSASTDSSNDWSDGNLYCINSGTVDGAAGSSTCTSCAAFRHFNRRGVRHGIGVRDCVKRTAASRLRLASRKTRLFFAATRENAKISLRDRRRAVNVRSSCFVQIFCTLERGKRANRRPCKV